MEKQDDTVKKLTAVLERYPRFHQALLDADVWWHDDGRMEFRTVAPDDPEIREGSAAFAAVLGMDLNELPPDAPVPERPNQPPSRFGDRRR